jgi:hypothetical protein
MVCVCVKEKEREREREREREKERERERERETDGPYRTGLLALADVCMSDRVLGFTPPVTSHIIWHLP